MTPPGYRTDGSLWSGYEGVWHLDGVLIPRATPETPRRTEGLLPVLPASSVTVSLDGNDDDLTISGYQGIRVRGPVRFPFGSGRYGAADLPVGGRRVISQLCLGGQGPRVLTDNSGGNDGAPTDWETTNGITCPSPSLE